MVLNPNGIEPTFLKLDSRSPGAGFIPIINSNVFNFNQFYEYKKTFNAVFKEGFSPVLGSIPRLPKKLIYSFSFDINTQVMFSKVFFKQTIFV